VGCDKSIGASSSCISTDADDEDVNVLDAATSTLSLLLLLLSAAQLSSKTSRPSPLPTLSPRLCERRRVCAGLDSSVVRGALLALQQTNR